MKVMVVKLKTTVLIAFTAWSVSCFAQEAGTVMYVMKGSEVVFQSSVSDIDSVTFDEAVSGDTLVIDKNDGSSADKILLKNIQQLSFTDENLSVETESSSKAYAFDDIAKLLFGVGCTTIIRNSSAQNGVDVLVYVTPSGYVMVESPIAIKSLVVFSIDGRMISMQLSDGVKTQCAVSLQNSAAGVYLIGVETGQGIVVKKIVKLLNK
jgi:hypothetical protein